MTRTQLPPWKLQGSNRPKGRYFQAVKGRGKSRATITLGYLNEDEANRAAENLAYWRGVFERTGKGNLFAPTVPRERVLDILLDDPKVVDVDDLWAEKIMEDVASAAMDAGAYGDLRLRDFVERVWMPVREADYSAKTAYNDRVWAWPRINTVLGDVPLKMLDAVRWGRFLRAQDDLSGRSKAILQTAYRAALKYAVEIEAITSVHSFRPVKGANKTTTQPGEALTVEEVDLLLDHTTTPMHRALFAFAIGQGCRPAEATRLRWEDVDWETGTVLIRGSKTSESKARIPMTPATRPELDAWWVEQGSPSIGHAFTWRGKPIKSWRRSWDTAVRRARLHEDEQGNPRRVIPYSARYTMATLAIVAGVKPGAIRSMLRHQHGSRLLETCYTRLRVEQVATEVEAFPTFG